MTLYRGSSLKAGDKVCYKGSQPALYLPFRQGPLPIKAIRGGYAYCEKPDGYFTTWMVLPDLKRLE